MLGESLVIRCVIEPGAFLFGYGEAHGVYSALQDRAQKGAETWPLADGNSVDCPEACAEIVLQADCGAN